MKRVRQAPAAISTNATGSPITTERPGAVVANMRRQAYRHDDPHPDRRVRSGSDFHARAEQTELDVVHHRDAECLPRGGVELRRDRLGSWAADPWRLVAPHGLAGDTHHHGAIVLLIHLDGHVLEDPGAVDEGPRAGPDGR